ncbi:MAG: MBL fold metallo-hydrolase [bacterium]|nr:MBL fold metallo-hydrolase [bacterium]
MIKNIISIIIVLCMFGVSVFAQAGKIEVKTTKLGDNIYMMAGIGGNIGMYVGKDGLLLVDTGMPRFLDKLRTAVAAVSDKPVKTVINTHWHFDHVGNNQAFAKSGSEITAHQNVGKRMAKKGHLDVINVDVPPSPKEALPTITFTESMDIRFEDEVIDVLHVPNAHTDGDGVVHFRKANVVHTGDIVFNRGYPFIDTANGGSIDGMIAAVERIVKLCDNKTKIIPGHGPLSHKAELEGYGRMLRQFRDAVAKEMAAGKDLAAILAAKPTAELDKKWGKTRFPPDKFTEAVFLSLQRK